MKNKQKHGLTLKKGTKTLIYLLANALNETTPKAVPSSDILKKLPALCDLHSVSAMCAAALSDLELPKDSQKINEHFRMARDTAFKRRALFDVEREYITQICRDNKIWYCPLKGIILQDLYPAYEMREMADNDFLYDKNGRDILKSKLLDRGYNLVNNGVTNHEEYTKPPVYNFEFHTRLFMHTFSEKFSKYYANIKKKLIPDPDIPYSFQMSHEDFYVYFTAHAYKHYREGGTGIRTLTDFYVLNELTDFTNSYSFDKNKVIKALNTLGIADFEMLCKNLAHKLFSNPSLSLENIQNLNDDEKELLSFISKQGAYGTDEERIKSKMQDTGSDGIYGTLLYIKRRIIPDDSYYREAHPFIYRHGILKPFFVFYRLITRPFINKNKLLSELKVILKSHLKK